MHTGKKLAETAVVPGGTTQKNKGGPESRHKILGKHGQSLLKMMETVKKGEGNLRTGTKHRSDKRVGDEGTVGVQEEVGGDELKPTKGEHQKVARWKFQEHRSSKKT